jgi:hypothetical protein
MQKSNQNPIALSLLLFTAFGYSFALPTPIYGFWLPHCIVSTPIYGF